jgi:hypothetical protein
MAAHSAIIIFAGMSNPFNLISCSLEEVLEITSWLNNIENVKFTKKRKYLEDFRKYEI